MGRKERTGYFSKIYDLKAPDDAKNVYRGWADTYEADVMGEYGYIGPKTVTTVFRKFYSNKNGKVLDAGCGTGLVGVELKSEPAFNHVSGTDISEDMLDKCREKDIYDHLVAADMTAVLPYEENYFDACISVGTFILTHVLPSAMLELFRIVKPGGIICVSVSELAWLQDKYLKAIEEFEFQKRCEIMEISKNKYLLETGVQCYIVTLKVLG